MEADCDMGGGIELAQDRAKWRAFVLSMLNLQAFLLLQICF
jgi:hypothetical protein